MIGRDPETSGDAAELTRRRALTTDAGRPEAVARRHAAGGRTARENVAAVLESGSFVEYGGFAVAAQRARRSHDELITETVADGLVLGTGRLAGDGSPCAVLAYDYTVMAGTQGAIGHRKLDRFFELIERMRLPTILFAEGGGGRPSDTDFPIASWLDVRSFARWAGLAGVVPRVAVVSGRCFAGNAVLAGCADLLVATGDVSIGMGGPAMIAGGGLGNVAADDVGPAATQAGNGVIDLLVPDEEAACAAAVRLLSCLATPGAGPEAGIGGAHSAADQTLLRTIVPERERRAYRVAPLVEILCDAGSVTLLGERFAPELLTAIARIDGRTVGIIANNTYAMAGAVTAGASQKGARFLALCDAFGVPVVSLVDTPGFMVGPDAEATGLVRSASALLIAGARLSVPLIAVVLRRGYGLGAQAMMGGSLHEPLLTVAWPSAHLGPMGLEGAVRLRMRRELETISDPDERERIVRTATAAAQENAAALRSAELFEIDDVIDPADTRSLIVRTLAAATVGR